MKPIKIETWQCPVCSTIYETEEEAIRCLSQPGVIPSYAEGDIVYLVDRYPEDPKKPFLKRKITKVGGIVLKPWAWGWGVHRIEYALNEVVQVGRDCYVGGTSACGDDSPRLAIESDFHRLGDPYYLDESIVVSPETIKNWEEIL